jgi:uncharacterized protein
MNINVAQLLKKPAGSVRWYDLSEDIKGIDEGLESRDLLTGSLKMIRTTYGILVSGVLRSALQMECCRCLEAFTAPIEFEIEEEFRPSVDIHTGAKLPVTDREDEETIIDEHHVLDVTEIVRQAAFLAKPMHPLCHEDCAGLCALCGQELNEGACDCATQAVDPRFEILRQLQ